MFLKREINDVSNYRGITLLSTVGKLFARTLNNRLNYWVNQYNVYVEAQAGFRKNMGTVDNIFYIKLSDNALSQQKRTSVLCIYRFHQSV